MFESHKTKGPQHDSQNLLRSRMSEGGEPSFYLKKNTYLGIVNFNNNIYLLNHVSAETLTTGTNSQPAEVSPQ